MTETRNDKLAKIISDIAGPSQQLTAEMVLTAAQQSAHPLHSGWGFIWDKDEAARRYNLSVAQELLTSVKVTVRVEKFAIVSVGYVRNPSLGPKEQGSIAVSKLAQSRNDSMEAMRAEAQRILSCLERAQRLAIQIGLTLEFERMLAEICGLTRVDDTPAGAGKARGHGRRGAARPG